jgi:uncharacterized membrane protein YgdD (TMEM256/DUF423 family)
LDESPNARLDKSPNARPGSAPRAAALVRVAAALGFTGVALGAFGAHGLRDRLGPMIEVYRTGVLYQLVHALAALGVAVGAARIRRATAIVALFAAGVVVFSGSLYLLALTGTGAFGAITPIGGLALLGGWALLFFSEARG